MISAFKKLFQKNAFVGISLYQGPEFPHDHIKLDLGQYEGGSIDLKLDEQSGIATVCLNHPEKKNSLTGKMMVDLDKIVTQLETWKTGKGLLIFGAGHNFCSGGDLDFARSTGSPEGGYKMSTFMYNVLLRLQQLPLISVAFIEGYALGGGAELAISCDFRVFGNNSSMGFVHARMGLIPAWGGLSTAVRTLGYRRALDLVTTGRVVHAEEAEGIGLCDAVVADQAAAEDWLAQRTRWDASVVRAAKCVAVHCSLASGEGQYVQDLEQRLFSPLWGGPVNKLALRQRLKHK